MSKKARKKMLDSLNKQAFLDSKNVSLTAKEREILNSATAEELQAARAWAEKLTTQNTEELIAEEEARLEALMSEVE